MKLDEIIASFAERLTDIQLYQRAAKDTAKKELELLNEYAEQLKENPSLEEFSFSLHSMYFSDPHTGTARRFGFRKSSVKDRYKQVVFQKNKQYCWLLAEAYEEFEDFLEMIYAYIGLQDNSSWLMIDFGNISISDLPTKTYEWYLERAKKKRDVPQSILTRLRLLHPKIVESETDNKLNVNLKVAIELIAKLRHIIVHRGGKVDDRNLFLEDVLKSAGLWNQGKFQPGYEAFVSNFFGQGELERVVALIEVRTHPEISLDIHHDRFGELTGYLVAYAVLIYQCIAAVENQGA